MRHWILFTGHMIDAESRSEPRFPTEKIKAASKQIRKCLMEVKNDNSHELIGIAGGACGGDILFHEVCQEMDIPSEIYLALPKIKFKEESVAFAGKDWIERFDILTESKPTHIMPESNESKEYSNVWERANNWMLDVALQDGGKNMTLIALWDGKGGDGNGGTEHMVKIAKEKGAKIRIIDTNRL